MAVNCQQNEILERLLDAGAAASPYTGPLARETLPVRVQSMMEVNEYSRDGHRYTPLHLASLVSNRIAVSVLLKGGSEDRTRADIDERVQSGCTTEDAEMLAELPEEFGKPSNFAPVCDGRRSKAIEAFRGTVRAVGAWAAG